MTQVELDEMLAALAKSEAAFADHPDRARALLVESGVIDQRGNLTPPFSDARARADRDA